MYEARRGSQPRLSSPSEHALATGASRHPKKASLSPLLPSELHEVRHRQAKKKLCPEQTDGIPSSNQTNPYCQGKPRLPFRSLLLGCEPVTSQEVARHIR